MKILAVTQARLSSTRLPNKVLKPLGETTLLGAHISRILKSKTISKLVVATTFEEGIEELIQEVDGFQVSCFQGSLNDVLDRFYQAVKHEQPDFVVRLTSDCPLLDPELIDQVVEHVISSGADYGSNTMVELFPDGQDIEVFKFSALESAWKEAKFQSEREHVTSFIWKNTDIKGGTKFVGTAFKSDEDFGGIRMTVDNQSDYDCINILVQNLGLHNTWKKYAQFIIEHPDLFSNQSTKRNEGYIKSINND